MFIAPLPTPTRTPLPAPVRARGPAAGKTLGD